MRRYFDDDRIYHISTDIARIFAILEPFGARRVANLHPLVCRPRCRDFDGVRSWMMRAATINIRPHTHISVHSRILMVGFVHSGVAVRIINRRARRLRGPRRRYARALCHFARRIFI